MSNALCLLQTDPGLAARPPLGGVSEHPGAGPEAGFSALEQSVLWLGPYAVANRATGAAEETLFVLEGHGSLRQGSDEHHLEPETGVHVPADRGYDLQAGADGMHLVCVRIPDPESGSDAQSECDPHREQVAQLRPFAGHRIYSADPRSHPAQV